MSQKDLYEYLCEFITPERKALFERILAYRTRHFTVAVEDIFQARNASAVVRSCECFGIQDIHIIENDNEYQVSKQIARGAEEWLDLHIYDQERNNSLACIKELRSRGYQIIATTPHTDDCVLEEFDITQKSAFFFGGEKPGLTETVKAEADGFLKIPIVGATESFNLSVAAAIVLYTLTTRLRQRSDIPWQLSEKEKLEKKLAWVQSKLKSSKLLIERYYKELEKGRPFN